MSPPNQFVSLIFGLIVPCIWAVVVNADDVRRSVERALPLLERAAAVTADQRSCFTCHGQAQPVFTFVEAAGRGFHPDPVNLKRQISHAHAHLKRGR